MYKSVPQIVVWLSRRSSVGAALRFRSSSRAFFAGPRSRRGSFWGLGHPLRTSQRRLPRLTRSASEAIGVRNRIYRNIPIQRCGGSSHAAVYLGCLAIVPRVGVGLRLYILGEYGNINYEIDISCVLHKQRPPAEFPCQSAADRVFWLQNRPEIRCRQGRQNRTQVIDIQSVSDVERALLRG
jgi:hypothetical protein